MEFYRRVHLRGGVLGFQKSIVSMKVLTWRQSTGVDIELKSGNPKDLLLIGLHIFNKKILPSPRTLVTGGRGFLGLNLCALA